MQLAFFRLPLLWAIGWELTRVFAADTIPLSSGDMQALASRMAPLPRQFTCASLVRLEPNRIRIDSEGLPPSLVVTQAVRELEQALRLDHQTASASGEVFNIVLRLGGEPATVLRGLKNPTQAYAIQPGDGNRALRITAIEPAGLLYGVKTLGQLIQPVPDSTAVKVPLATVLDWPEIADRGLWGVDAFNWLPWLADRKLNYVEQISALTVDPVTKRGTARPKPGHERLLDVGPALAIQYVPVVLHLEQLEGKGLFEAFPNLRGKGAARAGVICYSQPEFPVLLADWLVDLSCLPHVREVDVWLTENLAGQGGCRCRECKKADRSVLELRAVLRGWELARVRAPQLGLRVLTSEETYRSHKLLFAELPRSVKLWYYHSLLTYTAREQPIIPADVAALVNNGHWVGVCPSLVAHVGFPEPFSSGQFVRYRVGEFVDKKLNGILAYPSPRVAYSRFNLEALAEWSWNPTGRSPREFARAYAVRQGIPDPETFADWAELHGRVAWDIYGSDWPGGEQRRIPGPVAELLVSGKLPAFGEVRWGLYGSPWGQFNSPEALASRANDSERAVALARKVGVEEFLEETLVVNGYIRALCALHQLQGLVVNGVVPGRHAEKARPVFESYTRGLTQSITALSAWEQTVGGANNPGLVRKPLNKLHEMVRQMEQNAGSVLKN